MKNQDLEQGYFGCLGDGALDTDYRLGGSLVLPTPRHTFEENQVQYDQSKTRNPSTKMACTMFSIMGVITDLTGQTFTEDAISDIVTRAITKGFNVGEGWTLQAATDHVVKWWNEKNPNEKLKYFRIRLDEQAYQDAINLGYTVQVGYRGNKAYNEDYLKDGVLDETAFTNLTYGHAIRNKDKDLLTIKEIDNYNKPSRAYNVYDVSKENFAKLVSKRIYFIHGFVVVYEDDWEKANELSEIPLWGTKAYESAKVAVRNGKLNNGDFDDEMTIADMEADFKKLGIFTSQVGKMTRGRWWEGLRRLKAI
jgi:hypothetical protein